MPTTPRKSISVDLTTEQETLFVREYLRTKNATEAVKKAGYKTTNYTNKGVRLLKKNSVKELIRKELAKNRKVSVLDPEDVINGLWLETQNEKTSSRDKITAWVKIGEFIGMTPDPSAKKKERADVSVNIVNYGDKKVDQPKVIDITSNKLTK